MGLDFLRNHGARRMRNYEEQPFLLDDGLTQDDNPDETVGLDYEVPSDEWYPHDVETSVGSSDWSLHPTRFVDGKDVGRSVAWLQSREGYPVPVRLSEIGAVVLRDVNGSLRREFSKVERVVSLMVDFFHWDEVEGFAIALQEQGFRLLPCQKPDPKDFNLYDFERMRKTTQNRSIDEMTRLEKQALAQDSEMSTVIDGRLEPRAGAFDDEHHLVVGLVKTHSKNYLHPQGWRIFYNLRPGQRTPAFRVECKNLDVVSWYLRLDGDKGELPIWGIVRLEIPQRFFENGLARDWGYIDSLSRIICDYRCRDESYSRAAVSIYPIQRAEESLGALFTQADTLISHFYHLTNL